MPQHSLKIEDYVLWVHLGCEPQERGLPQEVRVSVEFRFLVPPEGIYSDHLGQTICYAQVCKALSELVIAEEFALIEKLAQKLWNKIKADFGQGSELRLLVHKVAPPVLGLLGGSKYQITEF